MILCSKWTAGYLTMRTMTSKPKAVIVTGAHTEKLMHDPNAISPAAGVLCLVAGMWAAKASLRAHTAWCCSPL
jgi:hypothetical protein